MGQGGASLDAQALDVDPDNDRASLSHAVGHPSVVPPDDVALIKILLKKLETERKAVGPVVK